MWSPRTAHAAAQFLSWGNTSLIMGEHLDEPAVPVTFVHPVGAGDSFVAGYLECLLGLSAPARLRTSAAMNAYAVTIPGDSELLPTRPELAAANLVDVVR